MQRNSEQCREVQRNANKCRKIAQRFREMQKNVGKCTEIEPHAHLENIAHIGFYKNLKNLVEFGACMRGHLVNVIHANH